ncbi:unnamed protein product [Cuscuta campestris]|uniref:RRM domain-containing protein n=1 Tax=Cuscuta campestris TaxID=132261 RepID=A0A484NG10_9ASTE|nr:unnamed protein product [Cuscuta campestris]
MEKEEGKEGSVTPRKTIKVSASFFIPSLLVAFSKEFAWALFTAFSTCLGGRGGCQIRPGLRRFLLDDLSQSWWPISSSWLVITSLEVAWSSHTSLSKLIFPTSSICIALEMVPTSRSPYPSTTGCSPFEVFFFFFRLASVISTFTPTKSVAAVKASVVDTADAEGGQTEPTATPSAGGKDLVPEAKRKKKTKPLRGDEPFVDGTGATLNAAPSTSAQVEEKDVSKAGTSAKSTKKTNAKAKSDVPTTSAPKRVEKVVQANYLLPATKNEAISCARPLAFEVEFFQLFTKLKSYLFTTFWTQLFLLILTFRALLFLQMSYSRRSRYSRSPSYKYSSISVSRSISMSPSFSRSQSSSHYSRDVENPGNNLYVTGLSSRVREQDLEDHFSSEGKVQDIHLVVDPWTRESRGFAFVTMSTLEDAKRCIKYLNRSVLEGRIITVERFL